MDNYQVPYYQEPNRIDAMENFEDETADTFFPDYLYEMLHRTHNVNNKRFIRSSLNPDFHFEIRNQPGINFWVECKLLELDQFNESIHLYNTEQINRYRSFPNAFLFLCVRIQREKYHYLVPFSEIKSTELHFSFLNPFLVSAEPPVQAEWIRKYLRF